MLVHFGARALDAIVLEDLGPLGVGGRHIFGVRVVLDGEPIVVDLPADDLENPRRAGGPRPAVA